jgi:hypothetical protein
MALTNRLLLGAAIVVLAGAAAEAADLPVKAKPVEYVKVCSVHGKGFYYIPGTDICLRVGGYVWSDNHYRHRGAAALLAPGNLATVGGFSHVVNRDVNDLSWRTRAILILDARSPTPAGTLRTYISAGWQYTTNALGGSGTGANIAPYLERAFSQYAGLTFGYFQSFFDAWSSMSVTTPNTLSYRLVPAFAYTAKFGSGLSGTVSIEDGQAHRNAITPSPYVPTAAAMALNSYGGQTIPDVVGNLRIDQAWGAFQVSGALHQLRVNQALAAAGIGDAWGWAAAAAAILKIAKTDELRLQAVFSRGAVEYNGPSASGDSIAVSLGQRLGIGVGPGIGPVVDLFDSFVTIGGHNLVAAWSATAQFQHRWNAVLRSSVFIGYLKLDMPAAATAFGHPDFRLWQAGANLIVTPAPGLDFSAEVVWTNIATDCANLVIAACIVDPTRGKGRDIVGALFRGRRNF